MSGLLLESTTCGRCGGSGRYGPTSVYAGRCFKCGGRGAVLTPRGRAAQAYLNGLRRRRVDALQVGDLVFAEGFSAGSFSMPSRWHRVVEIVAAGDRLTVNCDGFSMQSCPPSLEVTVGFDAAAKAEHRRLALEYQATLTKAGKPRKVRGSAGREVHP